MSDADKYRIGYGKPPQEHQFKKGVSGNPKGRPKGIRNFKTDVQRVLKAPVPITEGGRRRSVSTQEATLLRLREKALKGDARALDKLIELARAYNVEELAQDASATVSDTDRAIIDRALQRRLRALDHDLQDDGDLGGRSGGDRERNATESVGKIPRFRPTRNLAEGDADD